MNFLEERILKDGKVKPNNVLKVDGFLNHQMDISLMEEIGREFKRRFHDKDITKVLTIEASGIGIACLTAAYFGVPVVFAKKTKTNNIYADVYTSKMDSYTHGTTYDIVVSKQFLNKGDKVLIVDDFLANGNAALGILDLAAQAGAEIVGMAFLIEKGFQAGGKLLREKGIHIESLAIIESLDNCEIKIKD